MKFRNLAVFVFVLSLSTPCLAQSRDLSLTPAAAGDLRVVELVEAPPTPLMNTSREAVSFTWQATDAPLPGNPEAFRAVSRSFGLNVSASELAQGVSLRLDAPGAVLRVSAERAGQRINPDRLTIALASGREMTARAATDQLVQRDDLAAANGLADSAGLGIRLARELGAGEITLRYPMSRAGDRMRIDVFDRNSEKVLALQSAADHFVTANEASVRMDWRGTAKTGASRGFALSPDGTRHRLVFGADGRARLAAPERVQYHAGLWEWHVASVDQNGIRRDAKTVFALTAAVARFDNRATVTMTPDQVMVTFGTQIKSPGRYEVRATLVGTAPDGQQVAALTSATASWLEPGAGELGVSFDAAQIKALGLAAPFSLRNLTLLDQSRMGTLERREDALRF